MTEPGLRPGRSRSKVCVCNHYTLLPLTLIHLFKLLLPAWGRSSTLLRPRCKGQNKARSLPPGTYILIHSKKSKMQINEKVQHDNSGSVSEMSRENLRFSIEKDL